MPLCRAKVKGVSISEFKVDMAYNVNSNETNAR